MKTKYIDMTRPCARHRLAEAAAALRNGGLVAFPTETVYGLGANGLDEEAVQSIYRAKGRPSDNPLILHVAEKDGFSRLAVSLSGDAQKLIDAFCPGPITLIVKRKKIVPDAVTGGLDTVGVRMPDHAIARELIRLAGVPVAAPSANTSGRPSPTTAQMVLADLDRKIDAVVDGGTCRFGVESTIVDCSGEAVTVLRPGAVTKEMLESVVGAVTLDPALVGVKSIPKAPGMKYAHYAPRAPLYIMEGPAERMAAAFRREIAKKTVRGQKVGVIASDEVVAAVGDAKNIIAVSYGRQGSAEDIAPRLYALLRYFDDKDVDVLFGEGIAASGMGLAVMNRLHKAAGFKIISIG